MDPTGVQNRLSGGKRRKDAYSGEEEVVNDNQKVSRRWMSGRGDEIDSKDHLDQVSQAIDFRGMSVDHWMRLQQQKMEPAAPSTPMNLQQPLNLQRSLAASMHDIRAVDTSKQAMLPCPTSQQITGHQQSAHQQLTSQQVTNQQQQQLNGQNQQQHTNQQQQQQQHTSQQLASQQQQLTSQQLTNQQQLLSSQQLAGPQQQQQLTSQQQQQLTNQKQQQHTSQQPSSSGGQIHKFQHLGGSEQIPQHMQLPYLDISSPNRSLSSLPPLPLSFRPPPIFAESDLRHSPTSSSSNQYPLQNVMSHQQRLSQGSPLLPDSDDDRFSSMLSNQSSLLQQQPSPGLVGPSNSLVLQEMQASAAWYSSMRELDTQAVSSSRLGRASLSGGQNVGPNVSLYSSPSMSDLTTQSGLAPLPYQSCSGGTSFRESPGDQDQLLESPLGYGISGSSSSSVVGPKCSASSLPRLNNKPVFQTDFPRRGVLNGPFCQSSSGDLLMNPNMAGILPDESCYIPQAPPPKPIRTYTKVYKLGAIGRALDVTRFSNYTELRCELARMFNLEGQLDQRSGWQLVFLDNENDILLLGDDPWDEFVTSVRGIRILSPTEVFFYMNEDRMGTPYNNTLNPGSLKQY